MNAKEILATHRVWRLFNRKGRVTEARLTKALGRSMSPAKAVANVTKAYSVPIHKDGDAYEVGRRTKAKSAVSEAKPTA